MDPLIYCRERNLVDYSSFIDNLKAKPLIFIGEAHPNKIHQKNEELILEELVSRTGKKFNILAEDPADTFKIKMLKKFSFNAALVYLPSENRPMAKKILENLSSGYPNLVIVGSWHLKGGLSADDLVRKVCPEIPSTAIFQEEAPSFPSGLYRIRTKDYQDYLLVGCLETLT